MNLILQCSLDCQSCVFLLDNLLNMESMTVLPMAMKHNKVEIGPDDVLCKTILLSVQDYVVDFAI